MLSDWKFFMQHINKSRRKKLARWIEDNTIEGGTRYLHLYGWSAKTKKAEDGGMIVLIVANSKYKSFDLLIDNYTSYEEFRVISPKLWELSDIAELLERYVAPSLFTAKNAKNAAGASGKPFKGWKGGRPRRVLSADEKAQIAAARADGKTIDAIAAEMHISNRVVSAYCKMSK